MNDGQHVCVLDCITSVFSVGDHLYLDIQQRKCNVFVPVIPLKMCYGFTVVF